MPSQILTGIDYYDATFHQDRGAFKGVAPIHIYDLSQQIAGRLLAATVGLLPTTDFAYGARVQNTWLSARDRYDPPPLRHFVFGAQASPLDSNETNTRCMSVSSIASTTCSRYSAAPRARSDAERR